MGPSREGQDDTLGRLLAEETTVDGASLRREEDHGASSRGGEDAGRGGPLVEKTLDGTSWWFFYVLPRPAREAERFGTAAAQLDGKVLISAEMALSV